MIQQEMKAKACELVNKAFAEIETTGTSYVSGYVEGILDYAEFVCKYLSEYWKGEVSE